MHEAIPHSNDREDDSAWSDTLPIAQSFDAPTNPSRRGFLKKAGAVVTGVAALGALGVVARKEEIIAETIGREEAERGLREIRERLRKEYGIEVDFGPTSEMDHANGLEWQVVTSILERQRACETIEQTFMQYPPMIYKKRAIITRIRVVNDLDLDKDGQIAGQADMDTGDIVLEYEERRARYQSSLLLNKEESAKKQQRFLHHEIEHMVDIVDEDKWFTDARTVDIPEEVTGEYRHLFYDYEIEHFVQKAKMSSEEALAYKKNFTGFARRYGKKSGIEDRATILEALYGDPDEIARRLPSDPVLARKVNFMKKEYFTMSRGVMNDKYWEVVAVHQDNPKLVAEYVKLQAEHLLRMSDEELRAYAQTKDIELSDEELRIWRDEIALGVERIDRQPL